MYFKDETIENWLKEDVPYFDLTTHVLNLSNIEGKIIFISREDGVLCGSEEVSRLFQKLNIMTTFMLPSGSCIKSGQTIFEAEGNAEQLHTGWKVALNIFEYSSGIATRTNKLVTLAKEVNASAEIVTTRKVFPGTKELSVKAALVGGGSPHRLGLSETIVVFQNHINLLGGIKAFSENLKTYKSKAYEKRFLVEVENENDAYLMCEAGADALQFDKFSIEKLTEIVKNIREKYPNVILIATGGVNQKNVADYAKTGVDGIATTSVYFGSPLDMSARIYKK